MYELDTNSKISKRIIQHMYDYNDFEGHVAFIMSLNNKKIIFEGKSRTIGNHNDFYGISSLHAEKVALENLKKNNTMYNLLVFRWKNGNLCLSKPCQNCMKRIKKNKIKKIYYSTENNIAHQLCNDMKISDCKISSGFRNKIRINCNGTKNII